LGSYLLRFYAPSAKHEAIAFAVQVTNPGEDTAVALAHLDKLAMDSDYLWQPSDTTGPVEWIT